MTNISVQPNLFTIHLFPPFLFSLYTKTCFDNLTTDLTNVDNSNLLYCIAKFASKDGRTRSNLKDFINALIYMKKKRSKFQHILSKIIISNEEFCRMLSDPIFQIPIEQLSRQEIQALIDMGITGGSDSNYIQNLLKYSEKPNSNLPSTKTVKPSPFLYKNPFTNLTSNDDTEEDDDDVPEEEDDTNENDDTKENDDDTDANANIDADDNTYFDDNFDDDDFEDYS